MLARAQCSTHTIFPSKFKLPSSQTFTKFLSLLDLCNDPNLLKQIQARFILHGHHQNPTLASSLISRYASFGLHSLSLRVFKSITSPNSTLYIRVLGILANLGESEQTLLVYDEMLSKSMYPDEITYPFVLRSCRDVKKGRKIHGCVVKLGFSVNEMVGVALMEMYRGFSELADARKVFDEMSVKGFAYWSGLIDDCCKSGDFVGCFLGFKRMMNEMTVPDSVCVVNLLRASVDLKCLNIGKIVHGLIVISGLSEDLSVNTALLSMYSKLGSLNLARLVFEKMVEKDCVVWNLMISAYSRCGNPRESMKLLIQMGNSSVRGDMFTAIAAMPSIGELKSLEGAKQIHAHVIRIGSDYQVSVQNSLIGMYCKCDSVGTARKVFSSVKEKTLVTWSTMIKGYVSHDRYSDALELFSKMRLEGFVLDSAILVSVLPAFVNAGALELVKYIHGCSIKRGLGSVPSVSTELLVSYAKCGCIDVAKRVFDEHDSDNRDIVTWNSMISACSKHGDWLQCFHLYNQMKQINFKPDSVTFLGLLTACVNSGRVQGGQKIFKEMKETYGCEPNQEHYACMVDLLGRAGLIDEASNIIHSMPFKPDARVWGPLLSASRLHSQMGVAELAAEKLISSEPENAGNYVLLSNIYAATGKWDRVAKMRSFLRDRGLKKTPGSSWLEVEGKVHEFRVADRSHPKSDEIYAVLSYIEFEFQDALKRSL